MKIQIPRDVAPDIITYRRKQAEDRELPKLPSLEEFADKLLELGYTGIRVSGRTLLRLFSGKMYPDLVDPTTGEVYDWCTIPARGPRAPVPLDRAGRAPAAGRTAPAYCRRTHRG
jgi:hypothetical protein